jgi:hypothetical protein
VVDSLANQRHDGSMHAGSVVVARHPKQEPPVPRQYRMPGVEVEMLEDVMACGEGEEERNAAVPCRDITS